jgi:tRNA-specific 2-thiouridylase
VATGHYARVDRPQAGGPWRLRRGLDASKDQSYFLFGLTQEQLARAIFPLGEMTKDRVRELARGLGLAVANKRDSQEICFVPGGDYASVVERREPGAARPGRIVDGTGRELGRHGGVHRFTVGQRKGLGLSSGEPQYVIRVRGERAEVVVGTRPQLERRELEATDVNWISGAPPAGALRLTAQIRSRHSAAPAVVEPCGEGRVRAVFDEPQRAITPGQAVVFYDGDELVGGGWIRLEN